MNRYRYLSEPLSHPTYYLGEGLATIRSIEISRWGYSSMMEKALLNLKNYGDLVGANAVDDLQEVKYPADLIIVLSCKFYYTRPS